MLSVRGPSHYTKHEHKTYLRQSKSFKKVPTTNYQYRNTLEKNAFQFQLHGKQKRSENIVSEIFKLDEEICDIQHQIDTNLID